MDYYCLTISHMRLSCLPSGCVGPGCLFLFMHGVVLALWRARAILGHGCGIQGQNYVAMFQGNEM